MGKDNKKALGILIGCGIYQYQFWHLLFLQSFKED